MQGELPLQHLKKKEKVNCECKLFQDEFVWGKLSVKNICESKSVHFEQGFWGMKWDLYV